MASDKLFYMLATRYPASVLKWLGISDCDNFKASSYTVKALERHLDIVFENQAGDEKLI